MAQSQQHSLQVRNEHRKELGCLPYIVTTPVGTALLIYLRLENPVAPTN